MKDHTTTYIASAVALFAILSFAVVGLEAFDSENTTEIVAVLGTGMVAVFINQILSIAKQEQTAKGINEIKGSLNGDLDKRIAAAVRDEFAPWERQMRELRAAVDAMQRSCEAPRAEDQGQ